MANYSVNTCFHLAWPKEACDALKQAIICVADEAPLDSAAVQALGPETRKMVERFQEGYEPLGITVIDHQDGGVIVMDEDGMFAPYMTSDLLSAIMKDYGIQHVLSVTWSEDCDKHRVGAFSGGGAVVSASDVRVFHVSDWIEKTTQEMRQDLEENPPSP